GKTGKNTEVEAIGKTVKSIGVEVIGKIVKSIGVEAIGRTVKSIEDEVIGKTVKSTEVEVAGMIVMSTGVVAMMMTENTVEDGGIVIIGMNTLVMASMANDMNIVVIDFVKTTKCPKPHRLIFRFRVEL
ncbi:MAG: hypothetical protein JAZ20_14825, partial [Candidatus Thiodiazotropha weberae]|nr:hypothetical protein [Candidatus Thiodiazotropha lotti]MCW4208850.1 hypothetical protein [Candidatus Thiodiazotropha lotti]